MSTFTYQKLADSNKKTVIKLTGFFTDSTQESNTARISANTLFGALDINNNLLLTGNTAKSYYDFTVYKCWFDVNVDGYLSLFWNGANSAPIFVMKNNGEYNTNSGQPSIKNNAISPNGDIGIETVGAVANNNYTIIIELHKNNRDYNYGQLTEPSVFNYGNYGVTP
jgi:hypothetical protein